MNWCEKSDGELVTAFAGSGAEEAFEELVRRHAGMVFRTCRRVTGSHQDAEDATQAVFSTLVLKAACLGSYSSLAGWLYSTAWHVSRRYRRQELTRRQRELRAQPVMPVEAGTADGELSEEVYRALEMLPPDYRDAIVLHHLEGLPLAQVAEVQDCPVGTVAARLSRGRALMRERLSWRGIVMSDAAITGLVLADLANEAAPPAIARNAAMAAASTTAGAEALTLASAAVGGGGGRRFDHRGGRNGQRGRPLCGVQGVAVGGRAGVLCRAQRNDGHGRQFAAQHHHHNARHGVVDARGERSLERAG